MGETPKYSKLSEHISGRFSELDKLLDRFQRVKKSEVKGGAE